MGGVAMNLVIGIAAIYAVIVGGLFAAQTWLIFPTGMAAGAPVALPPEAERITLDTADGERIGGLRLPGPDDGPRIIAFGGNAWNADHLAVFVKQLLPETEVVAFHYRGYAPSEGTPSARALMEDALVIHDGAAARFGERRTIALGLSIGAAPAANLAAERALAGIVLVTPFDSLEALIKEIYFWVPVALLLRHRMPIAELMARHRTPTAVIGAEADRIVPPRRTRALVPSIENLVYQETIAGAGHNDLYQRESFARALAEAVAVVDAIAQGEGRAAR